LEICAWVKKNLTQPKHDTGNSEAKMKGSTVGSTAHSSLLKDRVAQGMGQPDRIWTLRTYRVLTNRQKELTQTIGKVWVKSIRVKNTTGIKWPTGGGTHEGKEPKMREWRIQNLGSVTKQKSGTGEKLPAAKEVPKSHMT